MRLGQRARHWRNPAYLAFQRIEFIDAQNGDRVLLAGLISIGDGGAEENLVAAVLAGRIDYFGQVQAFGEKTDAAVDLAQAALAIDIVAVFGAVAVGSGPVDHAHDFRALDIDQLQQLVLDALVALRRDVVFCAGRYCRQHDAAILVVVAFLGECFAHGLL